jgi:hypothetical protein
MATQQGYVWEGRCPHCGEVPALHTLAETPKVLGIAKAISTALRSEFGKLGNREKNAKDTVITQLKKPNGEFMIGVLATREGVLYAGHSGQSDSGFFKATLDKVVLPNKLVYSPALLTGKTRIRNRRYELASRGAGDDYIQIFDYQCAAPRIIQAALQNRHYPVSMTEIYCGGKSDEQTILSCGRCRGTVPYMLCPE